MSAIEAEKVVQAVGDEELLTAYQRWMQWDQNATTRSMIQTMAERKQIDQLRQHLLNRLQFGTAGLRGKMGCGTDSMNDLVIIQTSQGLAKYVMKACARSNRRLSVVIGYDGRHNSHRYAELTAAAFFHLGFKIYLAGRLCPTPFVPFGVKHLCSKVGVMITASHNPKEDNGYKVYWNNGAQIVSPHDKNIQEYIMDNLEPGPHAWVQELSKHKEVTDFLPIIEPAYYKIITENCKLIASKHQSTPLRFTYTPMHGVGCHYVEMALAHANVDMEDLYVVPEQRDPDPNFTTVKFPNPEEGKSALNLAIKLADVNGSPIIMANDPDADRLAVAEKSLGGEWKIFNGNELGSLLGWWAYKTYRERPNAVDPSNIYMIASTVSSKFLKTMAEYEGFNFIETLTGFKWMGQKAVQLHSQGKVVIFAFEEAIGFMMGTAVLDKDGVSAAAYLAQMATILYNRKLNLYQQLQLLYEMYGYHVSDNSYYVCYDPETITKVFENIRTLNGKIGATGYPVGLMNNKYKVTAVRDLTTGYDSEEEDKEAKLPVSKSSQMITFKFDNDLVLTLRTSGTEPKIKYYSELRAPPAARIDRKIVEQTLKEMITAMIAEWLQPEKWGLLPRSD